MNKGKLIFRYGTMNSGKSAQLLMEVFKHESQGKRVLALKPTLDTRSQCIESRVNIKPKECIGVDKYDNVYDIIYKEHQKDPIIYVVVDEAQFLTQKQVEELVKAKELGIIIIAYGLKNTYIKGELFEGSRALLFYADSYDEIKTMCRYCNSKATQNLMLINETPVYDGKTIQIGDVKGNQKYVEVCNYHYLSGGRE